jgi:hypothetical protein
MRTLLALTAVALAASAVLSPASAGASVPPRCHVADLVASTVETGGSGAGTLEIGVRLRNRSHHTCRVYGYPGLALRSSSNHAIPGYAVFDHTRIPHRVVLAPGAAAVATVRYSDVPHGSETCRASRWLLVTPPDEYSSLRVRASLAVCNHGRMLVGPLRPA